MGEPEYPPLFRACIQAPNHQYLVFKTTQGFILRCEDLTSGTVETVRFNNGLVHHLSPAEMRFVIDDELSAEDQSHIFAFVQIILLRTIANLMPLRRCPRVVCWRRFHVERNQQHLSGRQPKKGTPVPFNHFHHQWADFNPRP